MTIATMLMPSTWPAHWRSLPRLVRFLLVGGFNTLFGYGAYAALLAVGFHFATAALLGTIAGVAFNYLTTGGLVFEHLSGRALVRFVSTYVFIYLVNVAGLACLARLGLDPYISGLVLILPMALVSYLSMSRFVFGGGHAPD
jgi:putative flippase GtrA